MNVQFVSVTPDAEKTMGYIARVSTLLIKIMKSMLDY